MGCQHLGKGPMVNSFSGGRIIDNLQIDNWQIDNQNLQIDNQQIDNLQITFIS